MSLIPLERDVLSLELGAKAYRDIFLDSLYDSIYEMARSLVTLQRAFGLIPRILGKGDGARVRLPLCSSAYSTSSLMHIILIAPGGRDGPFAEGITVHD